MACNSLVTPDMADTTTSTRAPSAAPRSTAMRPIVSQRSRLDTEVPPNFSTSHFCLAATNPISWFQPTTGKGKNNDVHPIASAARGVTAAAKKLGPRHTH